uniref:Uncharacterized protein n=1 Tax=Ditylenchus dipsaci TaxID=166011 RepID=A0A915D9C8_9BILA
MNPELLYYRGCCLESSCSYSISIPLLLPEKTIRPGYVENCWTVEECKHRTKCLTSCSPSLKHLQESGLVQLSEIFVGHAPKKESIL